MWNDDSLLEAPRDGHSSGPLDRTLWPVLLALVACIAFWALVAWIGLTWF